MVRARMIAWTMVVIVVVATMATTAVAAESSLKIGIVDIARVYNDAPRIKQYYEEATSLKQSLGAKLDIRLRNLMLDENEINELIELKLKPPASLADKEKARIDELGKIERDRDAELKTLQATTSATDEQKARQKVLQDMQMKSKTTGETMEKDYNNQLASKGDELGEKARADIQEAVNKVAEAKGFTVIVAKDAVLFGGTDVTDAVIEKLDRKAQ